MQGVALRCTKFRLSFPPDGESSGRALPPSPVVRSFGRDGPPGRPRWTFTNRVYFIFLVVSLLLSLPAFCAEPLKVPFVAQKRELCGPAALAMIAQFYGQKVTQDEIAEEIYLPEIHGTLTSDLAEYAKRYNFWARQYKGTQVDIRRKISAGVPVIVLGKFGTQYHYFIVLAFDDFAKTVTIHTDRRADEVMTQEQFLRVWDRADRWALVICPPERAKWELSYDEHNDLGVFLECSGNLAAATGHYQMAATLAPEPINSTYAVNLGNAFRKMNLLPEAAKAFKQALKLNTINADAMNNLADVYCDLNANLEEAVSLCEQAIKIGATHRAYYFDTLGSVYLKQGEREKAIHAFESALATTSERQTNLKAEIEKHLEDARSRKER